MKKSRIILPAAALLALSSAAAVTGTVAWFTANRIRSVNFSGLTAVNPEQGLNLSAATDVHNTQVDGDATSGFTITHKQLRDASYDMANDKVYGSILDEKSGEVYGYAEKGWTADTKKYNNKDVFFATQFTLKFSVSRVEDAYNQNLILDTASSSVTAPSSAADSVAKALRIGLKTSTRWFVWAPLTDETSLDYVDAEVEKWDGKTGTLAAHLADGETTYDAANVIIGKLSALPGDDTPIAADAMAARKDTLGVLTTSDLTVTVTTWFEGLDDDCVTNAKDLAQSFTAKLEFTMRKSAKA